MDRRVMPYVTKYLNWAEDQHRFCTVTPSDVNDFEVEYYSDRVVVNLANRTCGCYHWELSGLPCAHAMACIIHNRADPERYVHEAYTKAKYMLAYEQSVPPMPGIKQWERVDMVEPEPPKFRKMPGRPSLKKRRKEPGEEGDGSSNVVKKAKLRRTCSKCQGLGHNITTCPNDPKEKEKSIHPPGNPEKASEWTRKVRERVAKRKAFKAHQAAATIAIPLQGQSSQGSTVTQAARRLGFDV